MKSLHELGLRGGDFPPPFSSSLHTTGFLRDGSPCCRLNIAAVFPLQFVSSFRNTELEASCMGCTVLSYRCVGASLGVKEPWWTPQGARRVQGEESSLQGPLSCLQGWELQRLCAFPSALPAAGPAVTGPGPGAGAAAAGAPNKAAGPQHPPGCPRHHRVCRAHRQVSCRGPRCREGHAVGGER